MLCSAEVNTKKKSHPFIFFFLLLLCGMQNGRIDIFNFQAAIFTTSFVKSACAWRGMPLILVSRASAPLQPKSQSMLKAEKKVREGASEIFPLSFNMSASLSIGLTCFGNTTDPASPSHTPSLSPCFSHCTILVECGD